MKNEPRGVSGQWINSYACLNLVDLLKHWQLKVDSMRIAGFWILQS